MQHKGDLRQRTHQGYRYEQHKQRLFQSKTKIVPQYQCHTMFNKAVNTFANHIKQYALNLSKNNEVIDVTDTCKHILDAEVKVGKIVDLIGIQAILSKAMTKQQ